MPATTPYLELCVRSLGASPTHDRQERVLDRLAALERTGAIDGYDVIVWGEGIATGSRGARTAAGSGFLHRVILLQHWCRLNGATVERCLSVKPAGGRGRQSVSFEPMVLLEYVGSRLRFASPHADGEREVTVDDHLTSLSRPSETRLVPRTDAITIEDPRRAGRVHAAGRQRATSPDVIEHGE